MSGCEVEFPERRATVYWYECQHGIVIYKHDVRWVQQGCFGPEAPRRVDLPCEIRPFDQLEATRNELKAWLKDGGVLGGGEYEEISLELCEVCIARASRQSIGEVSP